MDARDQYAASGTGSTGSSNIGGDAGTYGYGTSDTAARVDTFGVPSGEGGQGSTSGGSQGVSQDVQQAAGEVVGQAKETVGQVAEQAKERARSQVATQKDRAAEGL